MCPAEKKKEGFLSRASRSSRSAARLGEERRGGAFLSTTGSFTLSSGGAGGAGRAGSSGITTDSSGHITTVDAAWNTPPGHKDELARSHNQADLSQLLEDMVRSWWDKKHGGGAVVKTDWGGDEAHCIQPTNSYTRVFTLVLDDCNWLKKCIMVKVTSGANPLVKGWGVVSGMKEQGTTDMEIWMEEAKSGKKWREKKKRCKAYQKRIDRYVRKAIAKFRFQRVKEHALSRLVQGIVGG